MNTVINLTVEDVAKGRRFCIEKCYKQSSGIGSSEYIDLSSFALQYAKLERAFSKSYSCVEARPAYVKAQLDTFYKEIMTNYFRRVILVSRLIHGFPNYDVFKEIKDKIQTEFKKYVKDSELVDFMAYEVLAIANLRMKNNLWLA